MEYKNLKTGATFSSPCKVSGGNWVLVEDGKPAISEPQLISQTENDKKIEPVNEVAEETPKSDDAFDGITRAQIMQELDAFGIAYDKKANKKELYDLMMQGK